MGLLVAGTKYRGEFEERLKKLMEEIKQNDDIILVRPSCYPCCILYWHRLELELCTQAISESACGWLQGERVKIPFLQNIFTPELHQKLLMICCIAAKFPAA